MQAVNSPSGFSARKHGAGGVSSRVNRYYIAGGLAANIFRGSAVTETATSKQITVAPPATKLIGVFKGCDYLDASMSYQYRPFWGSGTQIAVGSVVEASVLDDPQLIFSVQVSGVGLEPVNIGALADLVLGAGSTATGNSADQLDVTTIGAGTQFRIEELDSTTPNSYGPYAKALVRISDHFLAAAMTGV